MKVKNLASASSASTTAFYLNIRNVSWAGEIFYGFFPRSGIPILIISVKEGNESKFIRLFFC
jgi:hypothetical protein